MIIDLHERVAERKRSHWPYLQIAAASIFSVLTLGAGLCPRFSAAVSKFHS